MKKLLFLAALLYSASAFSQKVDIDNYRFYVEYAQLPLHNIAPADKTFTVQTSGMADMDMGDIADGVEIRGWTYQAEGAQALVKINMSSFVEGSPNVKKEEKVKKNKEGKVISRKNYYTAYSTNTGRGTLKVYGPSNKYEAPLSEKGKKRKAKADSKKKAKKKAKEDKKAANPFLKDVAIETGDEDAEGGATHVATYSLNKEYSVETGQELSKSAARKAFDSKAGSSFNNQKDEFYSGLQGRITSTLNGLYGYKRRRDYVKFKRLDSKKHPEFTMFENATTAMKEILGQKRFNKDTKDVSDAIAPIIEYFKGVADKYTEDKKHPKRLKSAAMYNLAQIYLYLDMPDEAIAIGNEYIRWNHDKKTGEKFVKRGEELKHLLAFHDSKRFFVTDEDADKIESEDTENDGDN